MGAQAQNSLPALGAWREHLPYQNAVDVVATDKKIIAATPFSLFSINKISGEIQRISKVSGLSETGISRIAYDAETEKLFIAYNNSNIDVLVNGSIKNITALQRANVSGDKRIFQIYPQRSFAYLATGLGIVLLDAEKYQVKETWYIGSNGDPVKTNAVAISNDIIYAATDEGLKSASLTVNPGDYRNWQLLSGSNGLPTGAVLSVVNIDDKMLAVVNDSVFILKNGSWNLLFANDWPLLAMNTSGSKIFLHQRNPSGEAQVVVMKGDGSIENTFQYPGYISYPLHTISDAGNYWIADLYGGLTRWQDNHLESFRLNSPQSVSSGQIVAENNKLVVTAGTVNNAWNYQYNPNGFFVYKQGEWTNYNGYTQPTLQNVLDVITAAIDPRDGSIWAGSFGGGLIHQNTNGTWQIFKENSPLSAAVGDPGSYRVSGLAFDKDGNLWISNFGAAQPIHVLKKDGSWQSFTVPFSLRENAVSQIVIDDIGQKWIASPLGNGLLVFDAGSLDNPGDDKWRLYKPGSGNGNLPSAEVMSLALDKNGAVWVGTTNGVGVIECPELAFTTGCDALWPVVQEGGFANYLFKGQEVRAIAVDGANRKWMATATGVWLLNEISDKVLSHFTKENSPLLSNDVRSLAINGASSEVFFATANGLISFRGDATNAGENPAAVTVFPNPVPPGYSGSIGVRGLPENSIVKITELNGRLVYQTRSLGGQAVWNGKDYKGQSVASGVYLVMAMSENNEEKIVGKIVFVRGK
ncbi:MAG: two-component regulator propeller domain-containing protein [Flavisolibacter sp.]